MEPAIEPGEREGAAENDALSAAILGGGLSGAAASLLNEAARSSCDGSVAENCLWRAQAIAPNEAQVLIALYRFYFYKHRLAEAREVAKLCLQMAARDNGLAADWRAVRREHATFSDFGAFLPRFYLFTLKASAYLAMRLGDLGEGRAMTAKLLELDPTDKIGAKVLLGVLDRIGLNDEE